MGYSSRFAILLDGAFVLKKLGAVLGNFPTADDVVSACDQITNPIDGSVLDLSSTHVHARHISLLDSLELKHDFALRLGETATHGWQVGNAAMRSMLRSSRAVEARDLVPNITQKGVDLRIGLDIARIALSKSADTIVAVTGDSDLIPAFTFARREGIRVYLDPMRHGVRRELKVHCDRLMDVAAACNNPQR